MYTREFGKFSASDKSEGGGAISSQGVESESHRIREREKSRRTCRLRPSFHYSAVNHTQPEPEHRNHQIGRDARKHVLWRSRRNLAAFLILVKCEMAKIAAGQIASIAPENTISISPVVKKGILNKSEKETQRFRSGNWKSRFLHYYYDLYHTY